MLEVYGDFILKTQRLNIFSGVVSNVRRQPLVAFTSK